MLVTEYVSFALPAEKPNRILATMIISKELALLLVSMIPAATIAITLLPIIAFFLMKEKTPVLKGQSNYRTASCTKSLTHLPSLPEKNLTLIAPKNPPTAYMETIRDQIIVTVCAGGGSLCLSYQLLLMKRCMYCRKSKSLWLELNEK